MDSNTFVYVVNTKVPYIVAYACTPTHTHALYLFLQISDSIMDEEDDEAKVDREITELSEQS